MRNGNIGFVFQSFNLIDELTVFENVELPLLYAGVSVHERVDRVNKASYGALSSTTFRRSTTACGYCPGYCDEPENYIG